jgi:hypothetical protein
MTELNMEPVIENQIVKSNPIGIFFAAARRVLNTYWRLGDSGKPSAQKEAARKEQALREVLKRGI